MAIPKMSSKDLNGILQKALGTISEVKIDMDESITDMAEKLAVIRNEQAYGASQMAKISAMIGSSEDSTRLKGVRNKAIFATNEMLGGVYGHYGASVHPKFLRQPLNVFNLMTSAGPMFRDNVSVTINEEKRERFKSMLMHDAAPEKKIVFREYDSPNVKLEFAIDTDNLLGDTNFNMIEMNPFLPGSFHIDTLKVFDAMQNIVYQADDIKNVGPIRFMIDQKRNLVKVEMAITLIYQNESGKYPFGMKHMYFLNADFDPSSHVIAKIEKNDFIETISEEIYVHDQFGRRLTTATEEGIKMYLSESGGVLEYQLETSSHTETNPITRNTRSFFINVPLKSYAISSIELNNIEIR